MTTRRALIIHLPGAVVAGAVASRAGWAFAAEKSVTVGITVPLTGSDAEGRDPDQKRRDDGGRRRQRPGGVAGYKINVMVLDNGTTTAGQYDPAQAATNARKLVADPSVIANVGPEMSGSGKAMTAILSQGDLGTITPSSTNPDITDPKFAAQYRPSRQGDLFPHGDDRRLSGPQHGQLHGPDIEGEKSLHPRRQRRLRRRHGKRL